MVGVNEVRCPKHKVESDGEIAFAGIGRRARAVENKQLR